MSFASMLIRNHNAEGQHDLSANQKQSASINRYEISKSRLMVYSASELLATFNGKETDFLWDNLVPRVGTGLLVGQPDLGKSQLAKELSIMISKGSSEYLGLKLKPIHNHVLYIFTEDQEEGVSSSLHKQLIKHSDLDQSKLSLAFLRDETITELILKIDQFCIETPVDLVVIDAFGDIFSGTDSNNNIQMRRDIKAFDDVVRKHTLSILFVHHINKSGYGKNPSQELIQGGSGLTQKVRYALFLSRNNDGQKFLNVAKGNYSSSFYKDNRLPVDFDEDSLTFDVNGEWQPINDNQEKTKKDLSETDLFLIMKDAGVPYTVLVSKMMDTLAISKSTAERRIGKLAIAGKISKVDDLYFRSEVIQNDKLGTTLTSTTTGKNEGEGQISGADLSLAAEDETTFNPQSLGKNEGEGNQLNHGEETFTSLNATEIEGDGNEILIPTQYGNIELEDLIFSEEDRFKDIDPFIFKLNDIVGNTPFREDENFYNAVHDFFINGLTEVKQTVYHIEELKLLLMDHYIITEQQSSVLLNIFLNLKLIHENEDGYLSA